VSGKLSWSHYAELLTVSDDLARNFYEQQAFKENWCFREMKRQIDSALFQRIALSKNKKGVLELSEKGHAIAIPKDAIKDPYVFDRFINRLIFKNANDCIGCLKCLRISEYNAIKPNVKTINIIIHGTNYKKEIV
jgi:hypothetical protein